MSAQLNSATWRRGYVGVQFKAFVFLEIISMCNRECQAGLSKTAGVVHNRHHRNMLEFCVFCHSVTDIAVSLS